MGRGEGGGRGGGGGGRGGKGGGKGGGGCIKIPKRNEGKNEIPFKTQKKRRV